MSVVRLVLALRDALVARHLLPTALLGIVFANQLYLATQRNLLPGKGGGFGMFATIDSPTTRRFSIALLTTTGELSVAPGDLDRSNADLLRRAVVFPTTSELMKCAKRLLGMQWVAADKHSASQQEYADASSLARQLRPRPFNQLPSNKRHLQLPVVGVRVAAWTIGRDPDVQAISRRHLNQVTLMKLSAGAE